MRGFIKPLLFMLSAKVSKLCYILWLYDNKNANRHEILDLHQSDYKLQHRQAVFPRRFGEISFNMSSPNVFSMFINVHRC